MFFLSAGKIACSLIVLIVPLKQCNPQNTYWTCWPRMWGKPPYKSSGHSIKEIQQELCISLQKQHQVIHTDKLCPSVPSSWCETAGGRNASQKVEETHPWIQVYWEEEAKEF